MRLKKLAFALLMICTAWALLPFGSSKSWAQSDVAAVPWQVCFTPGDQCADRLIARIDAAKTSIRVQAYSFTATDIADALIRARRRGVDIIAILDKSQTRERYSMIDVMKDGGILIYIDACCAIAHNKVMIIDGQSVVTGSYNFTKAADKHNAENLLIIDDAVLAQRYLENWDKHRQGANIYEAP